MRNFYFLVFLFLSILSTSVFAQGNLPYEYLGIEYNGTIYRDNEDITLCAQGDNAFAFNAEYLPIGLTDNEYQVIPIPFTDVYPFDPDLLEGSISITADDTFSNIVDLPFDFCFFGETHTQLVVGANGRILFDTTFANNYDDWNIDEEDNLPTPEIEGNSIMGVYQDINIADIPDLDTDPDDGDGISSFTYGIFGEAPFRAFVVNYYQVPLYGGDCDDLNENEPLMQTYQIILHEGTSAIDVIVWNRNSCEGWNEGLGVIGIMNANSTVAYYPPGRNTGTWEAENEAWRFIPTTDGLGSATTLGWNVAGVFNTDDTTLVLEDLTEDTTVELYVDYFINCINTTERASITVNIDYVAVNLQQEEDITICEGATTTLNAVETYDAYVWYKDGTEIGGEVAQTLEVTEAGVYRVEYQTETCSTWDEVTVNVTEAPIITNTEDQFCDDGDGTHTLDLTTYYALMVDTPADYEIKAYPTMADAENMTSEITPVDTYSLSTGETILYIGFNYGEDCFVIETITLELIEQLTLQAFTVNVCEEDTNVFNLSDYQTEHTTDTSLSFVYFTTEEDANNNTNAIAEADVNAYNAVVGENIIYVRAEDANGCFNTTTLTLNINPNPTLNTVDVNEYTAIINATGGNAPLEYSVDGVTYQSSNTFTELEPGIYTAYVRSVDGCIDTLEFEIILLEIEFIPNVITPNGDGINDTWNIPGIQYFPGSVVKLYDRYGKRIIDIVTDGSSETVWDAVYLENHLHSTTYWYTIVLPDGTDFKGYLVIKNRYKK